MPWVWRRHFFECSLALGAAVGMGAVETAFAAGRNRRGSASGFVDLSTPGMEGTTRTRLVLPYPSARSPDARETESFPALVLLHGRGETSSESAALSAWQRAYGAANSLTRLRHPPIRLSPEQERFARPEQIRVINRSLARYPFGGFMLICPPTPNAFARPRSGAVLDEFAQWLEQVVLPSARARVPIAGGGRQIGLDGCSMGGRVALEVLKRLPQTFRSFGVVQPAMGEFRASAYARDVSRVQRTQGLPLHLLTSTRDPFRRATESLSQSLRELGSKHTLTVLPGPHSQAWLRATGTLHMLWWHHHALSRPAEGSAPAKEPPNVDQH